MNYFNMINSIYIVIPWDLLDAARRDVEKELILSIKLVVVVVVN